MKNISTLHFDLYILLEEGWRDLYDTCWCPIIVSLKFLMTKEFFDF